MPAADDRHFSIYSKSFDTINSHRYRPTLFIEVSLYDSIGVDKEGNEITLIDVLGTDAEIVTDLVENHFEQRRLLEKVQNLNKREKNVLELRFGLFTGIRKTQKEIARKLGISRSYVSRIEKRALTKLIKDFKTEGC